MPMMSTHLPSLFRLSATVVAAGLTACSPPQPRLLNAEGFAQGTTYSLQWLSGGEATVDAVTDAADAELERIDELLSTYRSDSVLERFNATTSTEPQMLPAELVSLLEVARGIHAASDRCFDPTVRPLVRAWRFDTDTPAVPTAENLASARARVGFEKLVIVDGSHVAKTKPDVEIDMSSIGQGYSAERLADVLEGLGATSYLAEIGGEMVARGTKADGSPWRIGVENPDPDGEPGPALRVPGHKRMAIVTSGTYRHFFDATGHRFSHILDARTGQPVAHNLRAVTVVGDSGSVAAGWGTALLCLGPTAAPITAARENLAALWWTEAEDGAMTLQHSKAFETDWPGVLE